MTLALSVKLAVADPKPLHVKQINCSSLVSPVRDSKTVVIHAFSRGHSTPYSVLFFCID